MAHDVFISYSTKDKTIADAVCAKLEENKIRVWIAPRDVPAGSNFGASIIKAINACKVFVLIWSAHTNTSEHIMNEVNQAFDQGITIIPFRIQNIQPTDEMRYYFGRTHWLDAIDPPLENHIAILKNTILANLGRDLPADIPVSPAVAVPEKPELAKEPIIETSEVVKLSASSSHQRNELGSDNENQPEAGGTRNLTRFIPFAAGGLAVITLVVLGILGVFEGSPLADKTQTLAPSTKTITLTSTLRPTATTTPVPAWIKEANAWADPILTAISYQSPDFTDDFSNVDSRWSSDPDKRMCANLEEGKIQITEGVLTFGIGPDCQFRQITHPNLVYGDFVVQMELDFQDAGGFNWSSYMWPANPPGEGSYQAFGFILHPSLWRIEAWDSATENVHDVMSGNISMDGKIPTSVTIIHQDRTFLYYLDSVLVASYTHEANADGPFEIRLGLEDFSENVTGVKTVAVDNVRAWNLNEIFLPERILAAIEYQLPDFGNDFSSELSSSWTYQTPEEVAFKCPNLGDAAMGIADGKLQLSIGPECTESMLFLDVLQYKNYVIQTEIDFSQAPHTGLEFRVGTNSGVGPLAFFIRGDESWQFGDAPHFSKDGIRYYGNFDASRSVKVTIIVSENTQVVYLDSTLVTYTTDLHTFSAPLGSNFLVSYDLDRNSSKPVESVILDNIGIWNLDKIHR